MLRCAPVVKEELEIMAECKSNVEKSIFWIFVVGKIFYEHSINQNQLMYRRFLHDLYIVDVSNSCRILLQGFKHKNHKCRSRCYKSVAILSTNPLGMYHDGGNSTIDSSVRSQQHFDRTFHEIIFVAMSSCFFNYYCGWVNFVAHTKTVLIANWFSW